LQLLGNQFPNNRVVGLSEALNRPFDLALNVLLWFTELGKESVS
jgi:hypothetical protein